MRVVFFGTPEFALPSLEKLRAEGHELSAVVCQPDRPAGRGRVVHPPPTKLWAQERKIPVLQPERIRDEAFLDELRRLSPDIVVVAAYGKILPPALLEIPRFGAVNVHASLLPKYRGAAPVAWALYHGEKVTGVTILRMNERMDAGDILLQRATPIGERETRGELEGRLAQLGGDALAEVLRALEDGTIRAVPQNEAEATFAPALRKEQGEIDWSRDAFAIDRQIRAFQPWPSAYSWWKGQRLKILEGLPAPGEATAPPGTLVSVHPPVVACGEGRLGLGRVQLEGRKPVTGEEFARGARCRPGDRLG
ncbi:MAG: methionyl-tRNA formyltransferase [Candidatus Binatia bacterium]|nr:MAG: methionyl-tRNA formyltransferase [Candidatus Binatia bacterium]